MTTLLTPELIERCHAGSRAKGFWDTTPPQGQQLMLVVSELAESLEAHRKGRPANWSRYNYALEVTGWDFHKEHFEQDIKDSPGDELADAYIRLCDFAGGYELRMHSLMRFYGAASGGFDKYPGTFGEALLGVTMLVCSIAAAESTDEEGVADTLAAVEWVAESEGIDLATHIDLKLRYNATRPAKHGKAY